MMIKFNRGEKVVSVEFSESISEVLDILNYMEESYMDKLPKKFIDFLEKNKSKDYIPDLNHSQKLNEMNLKEKTKDIIAVIYMNYWCSDREKSEYSKILIQNQKKYQEELRRKYNPDNIFKNQDKEKSLKEENSIIEYKQPIFKKIANKIKDFFRLK